MLRGVCAGSVIDLSVPSGHDCVGCQAIVPVLSHLDQSDDDNVELKIKTKVNSNCKIISFRLLRIKVEMASNDEANIPSTLVGLIGRRMNPSTD